jgi:hypothetical protein
MLTGGITPLGVFSEAFPGHKMWVHLRLLTDRIVDRRDPEYHIILLIGSGSHSDFKFARNDRNSDRSDPFFGSN